MKRRIKAFVGMLFAVAMVVLLSPCMPVKAAGNVYTLNVTEGMDIYKELKEVMLGAAGVATDDNPSTVVIPAGNYTLSTVLRLYSNVTLDATGATITYSNPNGEKHNMLISGYIEYNESSACSGYDGHKNITIKGGTWISPDSNKASMVKIMHAKNVTFEGATFVGGGSAHQVELAAIDGLTVKNCVFKDFKGKKGDKSEALQLDIPCAQSVYGDTYEDGTPMKNVTISNCTFKNVPRGLGTHTLLLGAWHENIVIKDNTFEDISEEAISTVNYYNCEIYNNTMKNCGGGILVQAYKKNPESIYSSVEKPGSYKATSVDDMKISIHDNTMNICYSDSCDEIQGIDLIGGIVSKANLKGGDKKVVPKGDYRVKGVSIENNTITTAGFGIHMQGACDVTVKNNTIKGSGYSKKDSERDKYDGCFIQTDSENVSVTNNTFTSLARCGIFVMENAFASDIKDNMIKDCPKYGIGFFDRAGFTGTMSGNKISGKVETGISVSTSCKLNKVTKNKVTKTNSNAVNVYLDSSVKEISNNTFEAPKNNGIIISTNSSVGTIKNNKITNPKANAINVFSDSKVTEIIGNTFDSPQKNGIIVTTKSSVGSIKDNAVNKAASNAINVYSESTITEISGNTFDGPKNYGILVSSSSSIGKVKNNKIKKPSDSAINVYTDSKITEVSGNTLESPKGNGIIISTNSSIDKISKNEITNAASNAINVYSKSSVKEISENTITNPTKNGVIISTNSTANTIKGNTITSVKECGIQLYSKSEATTISDNTISKPTKDGIFVTTGCTVGTIDGNTISDAKREGIQIYSKCKVKSGIVNNKIKNSKNNGMKITTSCTVKNIENNTITSAGSNGILLCNKAVVSKDVKKNKMSKVKGKTVSVTSGAKVSGKLAN